MAHNISSKSGKPEMMYVGQVPWHGLGTALDRPATSKEAMTAAGLDWTVGTRPVSVDCGDGQTIPIHSHVSLVREDLWADKETRQVLSVVGRDYDVLQNREAFWFFDQMIGLGKAVYETAGALDGGRVVWILARLPNDLTTEAGEVIRPFVLLANGHGRQIPVSLKLTAVRVVCANTLGWALGWESGPVVKVAHNASMRTKLASGRELLGLIDKASLAVKRFADTLSKVEIDEAGLSAYLERVFPDPKLSTTSSSSFTSAMLQRARNSRELATRLTKCGLGNAARGVSGTLWAAYNGVTDLLDHSPMERGEQDRLLKSVWFGQREQVKRRAASVAIEIALAGK